MSLKEAKKLVDSFKEKLDLAITKFQDQNSISSNNNGGVMEEKSLSNGHSEPVIKETETLKDNNHNGKKKKEHNHFKFHRKFARPLSRHNWRFCIKLVP